MLETFRTNLSIFTMSTEHHIETGPEPSVATFIRKIYAILDDHLFPEAVDWNTEGNALVIKKPSDFSQKVLPRYFKHNHISSFIRQLNMYGFQKKRSRQAGHVYMHELFQKGQKQLLCKIKRKVKDGLNGANNSQSSPQESVLQFSSDSSSLFDENQMLKGMKEDAYDKVKSLEQKVKELAAQNQKLVQHLQQQKQKEQSMASLLSKAKAELEPLHVPPMSAKLSSSSYKSPLFVKQEDTTQVNSPESAPLKQVQKISPSKGINFTINANTFTLSEFGNKLHEVISSTNKRSPQRKESVEFVRAMKKPSTYTFNYQGVKFEEPAPVPTLLEKRPFHIEEKGLFCEDGIEESVNKYLKCDSPMLDLRDMGKLQSGFFSNFGDNEARQRYDSDFDLMCFH